MQNITPDEKCKIESLRGIEARDRFLELVYEAAGKPDESSSWLRTRYDVPRSYHLKIAQEFPQLAKSASAWDGAIEGILDGTLDD